MVDDFNLLLIATFVQGLDMTLMGDEDSFNFDSSPSQNQYQSKIRNEVDQLWIALSPPSSEDDDVELFAPSSSNEKSGKKRPASAESEDEYSQFIDENQMKRTKLASNVKKVDTLCSLLFLSEEED